MSSSIVSTRSGKAVRIAAGMSLKLSALFKSGMFGKCSTKSSVSSCSVTATFPRFGISSTKRRMTALFSSIPMTNPSSLDRAELAHHSPDVLHSPMLDDLPVDDAHDIDGIGLDGLAGRRDAHEFAFVDGLEP